jgi:hypothetical protein
MLHGNSLILLDLPLRFVRWDKHAADSRLNYLALLRQDALEYSNQFVGFFQYSLCEQAISVALDGC